MKEFMEKINNEKVRVSKIANTMAGLSKIKEVYIAQFGHSYIGLASAISEIARVNVLLSDRGEPGLI